MAEPEGSTLSDNDLQALKIAAESAFREVNGVEGFGIGQRVLRIYVRDAEVARQLPKTFMGVALEYIVTGEIKSL